MNKLEPQKLLDGLKKSLKNKKIDYEKIIKHPRNKIKKNSLVIFPRKSGHKEELVVG